MNIENLVAWSGGKDSTVMLHYLLYKKELPLEAYFNDTTITLPDTLDYIHDIHRDWGFPLHILKSPITFEEYLAKKHFYPNKKMRWCTGLLKMKPLLEFYKTHKVENTYVGIRRGESSRRRKTYKSEVTTRIYKGAILKTTYPLLKWCKPSIEEYLAHNHIPVNPSYKKVGVSGCYFCPFYTKSIYCKLAKNYPELFENICRWENEQGFPAMHDFWVSDLNGGKL